MLRNPKVCVLRAAGTNCDKETSFAFSSVGADTELVHVNKLITKQRELSEYQILALPGGFSYGDDVSSGKILANELRTKLIDELKKFIENGKLIIGICNGFQVLVKSGLLPGKENFIQEASLIINDSGKFEDRWVHLRNTQYTIRNTKCVWVKDLPEVIYLPVAHGEGKFVVQDKTVLERLKSGSEVVFQYCNQAGDLSGYPDNPNGSMDNIAGICDRTGRIFGMMPHPERHIGVFQHPRWLGKNEGAGLNIFKNGVEYVKKHF